MEPSAGASPIPASSELQLAQVLRASQAAEIEQLRAQAVDSVPRAEVDRLQALCEEYAQELREKGVGFAKAQLESPEVERKRGTKKVTLRSCRDSSRSVSSERTGRLSCESSNRRMLGPDLLTNELRASASHSTSSQLASRDSFFSKLSSRAGGRLTDGRFSELLRKASGDAPIAREERLSTTRVTETTFASTLPRSGLPVDRFSVVPRQRTDTPSPQDLPRSLAVEETRISCPSEAIRITSSCLAKVLELSAGGNPPVGYRGPAQVMCAIASPRPNLHASLPASLGAQSASSGMQSPLPAPPAGPLVARASPRVPMVRSPLAGTQSPMVGSGAPVRAVLESPRTEVMRPIAAGKAASPGVPTMSFSPSGPPAPWMNVGSPVQVESYLIMEQVTGVQTHAARGAMTPRMHAAAADAPGMDVIPHVPGIAPSSQGRHY